MKSKIKLRHDKFIVCPYADKYGCGHPRCIRMCGQECYLKGWNTYGKTQPQRTHNRPTSEYFG